MFVIDSNLLLHRAVIDKYSFDTFPITFGPAVDGVFVTNSLQHALASGKCAIILSLCTHEDMQADRINLWTSLVAKVSVISGDNLDEGTTLSLGRSAKNEDELRIGKLTKLLSTRDFQEWT